MLKNNYALILIAAILCSSATAQELDIPQAHYPKLPKYAATANGFVPHGWTLEIKKSGDLNRDGRPDLLLVLRENNPKNLIESYWGMSPLDTNPRILAVAFAKNGGYILAMQNHTVIARHVEPNLSDVMESGEVSVVRGNLRVTVGVFANAGSWMMGPTTYTFRYQHGSFELIGYDQSLIDRSSPNDIDEVSINYLTGRIKRTTGDDNQKKVRWKKPPSLRPIPIASVDSATFAPDY